jgi:alanine-alpha-ketoisovalerate/valine-pyruvate aminotransferase
MKQTAISEMIQEFNKELQVATQIGNKDKIRTIKHLINIATRYLPNEKTNIKDAFEEGDWNWRENLDITSEDYYQLNFKPE